MRRKLSLKFKVGSIVATMAVGAGVISWIGMSRLSLLQGALTETVEVQGKRVQSIAHIQKAFASIILAEKNYLLDEDQKIRDEREKGIANQDKAIREEIESLIANAPADQKDDLTNLKKSYSDFLPVSESARKLAREGKLKEAIQISQTKGKDARLEVEMNAEAVSDKNQDAMAKAEAQGQVTYTRARLNIFLATFLSLGLGLFQAVWTMRVIGKSISQAISALTENSSQLGATAQSVASTSTQISQAATEQSSVVQETASSIEEMSSMVSKNSESARKASEVSAESHKSAVHGKEVVDKMMHSIQEIDASNSNIMDQIGQSNQQLTEIVRVISEIATKTQVINDIVFQTKLLSFNASVEAARAGEHGKGFAVVAEEVGNLAQMSGNAAREITDMLDNSIHKVENIVQETKSKVESLVGDNKAKVSEGVQIAKECGSVLDEIVGSISGLTNMAASISSASQEQSFGVREITQAMSQLDQVTQQNAAASEQSANAASLLSKQADDLNHVISSLNEAIYGGGSKAQVFTPSHHNKTKVSSGPKKTVAEAPAVKAEPALVYSEAKAKEVAKSAKPMSKKEAKRAVKAAEKTGTKTAGAEVIPLPVKEKAATSQPVENEIRLKTAGVGSLASLPSPDDERFKDI